MGISHNLQKIKPYFFSGINYWQKSKSNAYLIKSNLGSFFGMRLKDRLLDGHYDAFDDNGYPIRYRNNNAYYNYSTIFSYAFANYELYLEVGDKQYLKPLEKAVEYMKLNGEWTSYGGLVFPQDTILSAMNQGEALSIIARLYEVNKDDSLLQLIEAIVLPYTVDVRERGVKGIFEINPAISWYEERSEIPGKHILNGMNYALIGLYEIMKIFPGKFQVEKLFNEGIANLKKALPMFDNGYWSLYWINDEPPHYIASVMYHNLHIRQLEYFADELDDEFLRQYANKFEKYRLKFLNRMKAAWSIFGSKIGS